MKDAFYFPHFSNARHDRKIQRLRKELGIEGYGIYFMLLETLRDQHDLTFPMSDLDLLADEFGTSEQKVRVVICNYGLFEIDEKEQFFSPKMLVYLEPYFNGKEQRRNAANARWSKFKVLQHTENKEDNAAALRPNNDRNSDAMQSKVKESKVNKRNKREFIPPTLDEVKSYFEEKEYNLETAIKAFEYYSASDWHDKDGNKIINWKQKMIGVWFKPENKKVSVSNFRPFVQ